MELERKSSFEKAVSEVLITENYSASFADAMGNNEESEEPNLAEINNRDVLNAKIE